MTEFPKLKGIKWLSIDCPDLIAIKVQLEDKNQRDLGLPNLKVDTIESDYHVDISKLCGIRDFYPVDSEDPSDYECMLDFDGISSFVATVSKESMIKAWLFYKKHK